MSNNPMIIGMCGGSGSGKTTIMSNLKSALVDQDVCYISLDDYYIPRSEQAVDENGIRNFDLPTSIDAAQVVADLESLTSGQAITKTRYTFNNPDATPESFVLHPSKVYIVEGMFIYHYEKLDAKFDFRIFVELSDVLKLIRRIKRDRQERNYPLEDVLYRYEHHVMPAYKQYIERHRDRCDLILNNKQASDKAVDMLAAYVKQLLRT